MSDYVQNNFLFDTTEHCVNSESFSNQSSSIYVNATIKISWVLVFMNNL